MAKSYDVVFIGAGHNALVCAAYLARAGKSVLVLERREMVGGARVTEEIWPGFKVSTAAYVNSLLRPEIIKELELHKFGFELLPRSPSSFSPFPDGRSLMMGPDKEMTHREVSKFSKKDADALPKYEAMLERCADLIEPTLMQTPPSPWNVRPSDMLHLGKMAWKFKKMGPEGAAAIEILTGAARPILDRWFESEQLKVTLATDAVIGAMAAPSMPGTAYVLFHHVMGECNGARGVWGYVHGGMGGISNALAASAQSFGANIRCDAPVSQFIIKDGEARGVVLQSGEEIVANTVLSCLDAHVTFLKLTPAGHLPEDFVNNIKQLDYTSMTVKINVKLSAPPDFKALPSGGKIGPQHHGTMHICPTMETIERGYAEAKLGRPASTPMIECTLPTALDDTLAPPGTHLMGM